MPNITEANWFQKLFINEAKPALKRHSGSGGSSGGATITTITTEAEMDAVLANATDADIGKFYLYTGGESDKYENDAVYKIEQG